MNNRLRWEQEVTVFPETETPIDLGEFSLGEGDNAIWIRVQSHPSGDCPWPWSYGLLTWVTPLGRELGTVKVNGVCEGEVFRLFNGLSPSERTGRFEFTPRSYNLAWIKLGHPWTLNFQAESGSFGGDGGGAVIGAVVNSFVDNSDNGLSLVRVNFS